MDAEIAGGTRMVWALSRPQHLLVWALRAIVLGHEDSPALEQTFARTCGPTAGHHALATYHAIVKLIAMAGRRRLTVHVPGCARVSADEMAILGVISAAQASLGGDERGLREQIAALLGCAAPETLVLAAQAVGRILQSQGHDLRASEIEAEVVPEAQPTLH